MTHSPLPFYTFSFRHGREKERKGEKWLERKGRDRTGWKEKRREENKERGRKGREGERYGVCFWAA